MNTNRYKIGTVLSLSVALMTVLSSACEGGCIQDFNGQRTADACLDGPGSLVFANLSFPLEAILINGSFSVSTLGAASPLGPSIDLCADGTNDWAFNGTGYGAYGAQKLFSDGRATADFNFTAPGVCSIQILLPAASCVTAASLELEGRSSRNWWNADWLGRVPVCVSSASARNQTGFPAEILLDTRNWTLGSAQREFRVTSVNSSDGNETEIPLQVVDELNNGTKCFEASVLFWVSGLDAGETRNFYIYFNNPATEKSALWQDFHPRMIRNTLETPSSENSILGSLRRPAGCTVGPDGNFWVTDMDQNCVWGYRGTLGVPGETGSDNNHLFDPRDVVVTPDGKIAVSDGMNSRVQVFYHNLSHAFTIGVSGVLGSDNAHLNNPYGLGTDADGNIYVADTGNFRVQVFSSNGNYLATLGTSGSGGTGNNQFLLPLGLHVTASKDVFVVDGLNHRVQSFRYTGTGWAYNFTLGVTGMAGYDNFHFSYPQDVTADGDGQIFVSDTGNCRVQVFSKTSYFATLGMTAEPMFDTAHMIQPYGLALSPSKELFVADTSIGRVQVFGSTLGYLRALGGREWSGQIPPGNSDDCLNFPTGVSADDEGRVYIADSNNHRVQVFSARGDLVRTLGVTGIPGSDSSHFYFPRGLDVGSDGKLLVADGGIFTFITYNSNHRVVGFNDLNDGVSDFQLGATGASGNDNGHLNQPWDVGLNAQGTVAVSDKGIQTSIMPPAYRGHRVQVYQNLIDTTADWTYGISGAPGCDTTHLNSNYGVAVSDSGDTWVSDTSNNRVVKFASDGNSVLDAGINLNGIAGGGPAQFRMPWDVDINSSGYLFVTDTLNHRVQLFGPALAPAGQWGSTGVNLSDAFHFDNPAGLKVGTDDKVYIADQFNHRVVRHIPACLSLGALQALEAPANVSIDIGTDGVSEYSHSPVLLGKHQTGNWAAAVNALLGSLPKTVDTYGVEMVSVPVDITNDGLGTLQIGMLKINYNCELPVVNFIPDIRNYIASHASGVDSKGNVTVPVSYVASSAGGVRLFNLNLTADFAPAQLLPVPDLTMDEDTCSAALCNFSDYFLDDFDIFLNYTLFNATNASIAKVCLNGSALSVDCTSVLARNWTGVISARVCATDSLGLFVYSAPFNVHVRPVNDPPQIRSTPALSVRAGTEWTYTVLADDAENDTLTFSLDKKPLNMTIDPSTGYVRWTPPYSMEGTQEVTARVSDGKLSGNQTFILNVSKTAAVNRAPFVTSTPLTVAISDRKYSYRIEAHDEDNDSINFSLSCGPSGLGVSPSGLVEWTPNSTQKGLHEVLILVSDGKVSVPYLFNITVTDNITSVLPSLTINSPVPGFRARGKVWIKGTAAARTGSVEIIEVMVDAQEQWQAAAGKTVWAYQLDTTKLKNGNHIVYVRVHDSSGNYALSNITLEVNNADTVKPVDGFLGMPTWMWGLLLAAVAGAAVGGVVVFQRRRMSSGGSAGPIDGASKSGAPPKPKIGAKPKAPSPEPVDSVFLIYHDGRLITYFSRNDSMKLDATLDMIRKFVKASFSGQLGRLDSMQYENMNIIMERGIQMYLVVITPLTEFSDLRTDMRRMLNEVHEKYKTVFKIWDGEFSKVRGAKTMVERFAGEDVREEEPADSSAINKEGGMPGHDEVSDKRSIGDGDRKVPAKSTASSEPDRKDPDPKIPSDAPPKTSSQHEPPKNDAPVQSARNIERLRIIEDRFLKGEISELTYRDLKGKYSK